MQFLIDAEPHRQVTHGRIGLDLPPFTVFALAQSLAAILGPLACCRVEVKVHRVFDSPSTRPRNKRAISKLREGRWPGPKRNMPRKRLRFWGQLPGTQRFKDSEELKFWEHQTQIFTNAHL